MTNQTLEPSTTSHKENCGCNNSSNSPSTTTCHDGKLDSNTISRIAEAEERITGKDRPVEGGPTAQAQKHAGEDISSQSLHDITEGEKKVTGQVQPVKGGPTAVAQSELAKSRS